MNMPWATPLRENPIPLRPTDCGLLPALSPTLRLAEREVVADGLNVMLTAQLPPGLRLVPQIPERLSAALPLSVIVTVCVLGVPIFWAPKSRLAGENVTPG